MAVRSRPLGRAQVGTSIGLVFTVPADRVAIIKQLSIEHLVNGQTCDVVITSGASNWTIERTTAGSVGGTTHYSLPGRFHVLTEGESIRAVTSVGNARVVCSGALLQGDPS